MKWVFLFLCCSFSLVSFAEDTIFIRSLEISGRAINIDSDGQQLLIRLSDRILLYSNNTFEPLSEPVQKRYTWISKPFSENALKVFHTEFAIPEKIAPESEVESLLPGFYTNNITTALLGGAYYICYRGVVLEYRVDKDIKLRHHGKSVRHIFCNDSLRIISTYSGIFIDRLDNLDQFSNEPIAGTDYSNGELSEIDGKHYLCQDGLFELQGDTLFRRIYINTGNAAFRKLLSWNGKVISLLDKRICEISLDEQKEKKVILQGNEYSDLELYGDTLLCSDLMGRVYHVYPDGRMDTTFLMGQLHDLNVLGNVVMVSGDSGLFRLNKNGVISIINNGIPAMQSVGYGNYIFFTNMQGLYLVMSDTVYTIIGSVEFNRKALSIYHNHLYAGSIDGLYTIQLGSFESNVLPGLKPILIQAKLLKTNLFSIILIAAFIIIIIVLLIIIYRKKSTHTEDILKPAHTITPESLSEIISNSPEVTTIQALAEKLDTSVVQLNRKLKPYGETPLSVMQKVKKDIAMNMHAKGESIENISKRTGYSKRYIKEHFLKGNE